MVRDFQEYFKSNKNILIRDYQLVDENDIRTLALIKWYEEESKPCEEEAKDPIKEKFMQEFWHRTKGLVEDYFKLNNPSVTDQNIQKYIENNELLLRKIIEELYYSYDDDDREGCQYLDSDILHDVLSDDTRLPFFLMGLKEKEEQVDLF